MPSWTYIIEIYRFWKEMCVRAFWDSLLFFFETRQGAWKGIILILLGMAVTTFIVWIARNREALTEHLRANVAIAIAGGVATWFVVFICCVIAEPFLAHQEVANQLSMSSERERAAVINRQMAELQRDEVTKHLPQVIVQGKDCKSSRGPHTHIDIRTPVRLLANPYWPLRAGLLEVNVEWKNIGNTAARIIFNAAPPPVVIHQMTQSSTDADIIKAAYEKAVKTAELGTSMEYMMYEHEDTPRTFTLGTNLTTADVIEVIARRATICVFQKIRFKDLSGCYVSLSAQCLWSEGDGEANWHAYVRDEAKEDDGKCAH